MNSWQVFPTETRRFKHCTGIIAYYSFENKTWDIYFRVDHTEVYPHYSHRKYSYSNGSDRALNRLVAAGTRNGARVHVHPNRMALDSEIVVYIEKPIPVCASPSCKQRATVSNYKLNSGEPYFCATHRG